MARKNNGEDVMEMTDSKKTTVNTEKLKALQLREFREI